MKQLADALQWGNLTLKNRVVMAPMCQYAAVNEEGVAEDWHYVHYVSRAVGQVGLLIVEMTNIEPNGRISNRCLGLWNETQRDELKKIVDTVHTYGSKIAIQIAHAGRKAEDAPMAISSSTVRVNEKYKVPHMLTTEEVEAVIEQFKRSVQLAVEAGFDAIELHGAHGYLIHQFHSPAINCERDDRFRTPHQFGVEVIAAVKTVMPAGMPLIFRLSACEYMENGYDVEHMLAVTEHYVAAGVDVLHISSGGEAPPAKGNEPKVGPAYQIGFAEQFKQRFTVPVIGVGLLDDPKVANDVIAAEKVDAVAIGRALLRDPYWTVNALRELQQNVTIVPSYARGY